MNSNQTIIGFVSGLAIGTTLGILLAPDKGSVTRSKISEGANGLSSDLQSKISSLITAVNSIIKNSKEAVNDELSADKLRIEQINESIVKEI